MRPEAYIACAIVAVILLYFVVPIVERTYARYRGTMVVICPSTRKPVGIEVDVKHAALTSVVGQRELRLKSCT